MTLACLAAAGLIMGMFLNSYALAAACFGVAVGDCWQPSDADRRSDARSLHSAVLPSPAKGYENIIRFSLPIFEYHDRHRHTGSA